MTTITISIQVAPAELAYFVLFFKISDFEAVIEAIEDVNCVEDLENDLWDIL